MAVSSTDNTETYGGRLVATERDGKMAAYPTASDVFEPSLYTYTEEDWFLTFIVSKEVMSKLMS